MLDEKNEWKGGIIFTFSNSGQESFDKGPLLIALPLPPSSSSNIARLIADLFVF